MKINKEISSTPGATVFIALVLIAFLGPLSIHLFIPVLPFIRMAFSVSESEAQLAFSLAILSMALATPVYGTLSDRFGRLPVVIGGIGMFTLGSVVATFAPSIIILIIGRIIQGAGAACGRAPQQKWTAGSVGRRQNRCGRIVRHRPGPIRGWRTRNGGYLEAWC